MRRQVKNAIISSLASKSVYGGGDWFRKRRFAVLNVVLASASLPVFTLDQHCNNICTLLHSHRTLAELSDISNVAQACASSP